MLDSCTEDHTLILAALGNSSVSVTHDDGMTFLPAEADYVLPISRPAPRAGGGKSGGVSSTMRNDSGAFAISAVPPGDYTLFAWESLVGTIYMNTEFLAANEDRGLPVHINPSATVEPRLNLITGN